MLDQSNVGSKWQHANVTVLRKEEHELLGPPMRQTKQPLQKWTQKTCKHHSIIPQRERVFALLGIFLWILLAVPKASPAKAKVLTLGFIVLSAQTCLIICIMRWNISRQCSCCLLYRQNFVSTLGCAVTITGHFLAKSLQFAKHVKEWLWTKKSCNFLCIPNLCIGLL